MGIWGAVKGATKAAMAPVTGGGSMVLDKAGSVVGGKAAYMSSPKFSYGGQHQVGEARDREQANLDRLNQWAQGKGDPSAAQLQMNRGLEASQAQAAAAGRGQVGGNSAALGQRNAANMQASLAGAAATDAGMLRAAEQQAAQQQYTQAAGQFRTQAANEQLGAMGAQTATNAQNAQLRDKNADRSRQLFNTGSDTVGKVGAMVGSDARVKEKISKGLPINAEEQARYAKSEQGAGRDATKVQNEIRGYLRSLSHGEPDVYGRELMNHRAQQDQLRASRPQPDTAPMPENPYPDMLAQRPKPPPDRPEYGTDHITRAPGFSATGHVNQPAMGQKRIAGMDGQVKGHSREQVLTPQPTGAVPLAEALRGVGAKYGGGLEGYQQRIDDIRERDMKRAGTSWEAETIGEKAAQDWARKAYIETGVDVGGTGFDPYSDGGAERSRSLFDLEQRMKEKPTGWDALSSAAHGMSGKGGASPYEQRREGETREYEALMGKPAEGASDRPERPKEDKPEKIDVVPTPDVLKPKSAKRSAAPANVAGDAAKQALVKRAASRTDKVVKDTATAGDSIKRPEVSDVLKTAKQRKDARRGTAKPDEMATSRALDAEGKKLRRAMGAR